jgi:5,10-methylenetetrahydrofolate reductase
VSSFLDDLRAPGAIVSVELRPPRAELEAPEGIDAWIDLHHAIRALARQDVRVMLTDSAVGAQEENNLRHLVANLGDTVPRDRIIPFLTSKHSLEYCLAYADQTVQHGFPALVVLGGDKHVGRPRVVEHAWQLRRLIRERHPGLQLGGWANPVADPAGQIRHVMDPTMTADFFLTQIVSHHQTAAVDAFLSAGEAQGLSMPGVFGVFYYRSANEATLRMLSQFLPVPVEPLLAEFAAGASAADICARTIQALRSLGVRHVYISNLPLRGTAAVLKSILDRV